MNARFSMRILSVVWLVLLAILGAYSIDSGAWVRSHLPFMKAAADNRETISVAPYIHGKTPVVLLGEIKNPDNAYVHLKLRFRADSTEGNPNVFQTAPVNRGMRMEISGSTAAILVPDLSVPGDLKGLTLPTALKTGQWYVLEVEALNDAFVRVKLDGLLVIDYASADLSMETSQILIGGGFDASRVFRGQIDNISVIKGNRPTLINYSQGIPFAFYSVLLIGLLIFLADFFVVTDFYVGLGSVLFAVTLYNSFYFNSYFPITEGWFSAYAHLIRQGFVPYRDFYLFITPLYPMLLAAFQAIFGESFITLRILGIVVVLLLSLFLYLILVRRFSPLVSVIATVTAIFYYQSGVAHIAYDFIQFFNVFVLAATYLIIRYSDKESVGNPGTNQSAVTLLFLAGIMVSLAFLTKQSNGALIVVFSMIAVALVTAGQNLSYRLRNISIYMLGMALPALAMGIGLYFVSALTPFVDQVVFGAIEAKGSIWSILFSWIGRHANWDYVTQLKTALLYMSPLFALSLIGTVFVKFRGGIGKNQTRNIWEIVLFSALICATIGIAYYGSEFYKHWVMTPGIRLAQGIVAVSTLLAIVLMMFSIVQSLASSTFCHRDLSVIATMTLGLVFGNGTSAGIGEASVFLSFALVLALLMSLPNIYGIAKIVVGVVCLSFILFLTNAKFRQPYAWWYVSEPDVRESTTRPALPLLAGFLLSPDTTKVLEDITQIIQTHSRPGDDVFTFPNIPGFYVLADRWPHSKVVVPWFDFLPDRFARAEASRLRASPPVIIANLKLPEAAWAAHESLFREGKPLGQRDIQTAIIELTEQRKLYQLAFAREVSPGCVLELWHKRVW
jgi:hypothetical protein